MSYADFQIEHSADAGLSAAADSEFVPGYQPAEVRAVSVVVTTATTVAAAQVDIYHRPTAGDATGQVLLDSIIVPLGSAAGSVFYVDGLEQKVVPGESIFFDTDGGATAGAGVLKMLYQPSWENPANNANMTESA